jgi:signal transduction histidine kinase
MPHTILFVDDEVNILNALMRALRKEDYRILTASSSLEAAPLLDREPIAVIVSDEKMPHMGGADFLCRVKETHPDIIRILLTGLRDVETAQKAINMAECYRFLTKPWNDHDLRMTLRSAVEKYDLVAENRRLVALTEDQNRQLLALNTELEFKVAERTQQLIQSKKMAAVGLLAGGVAHEINNPVAGILALTQLLLKEDVDSRLREDLRKIEQLAYRCIDVVQEILDFSRQSRAENRDLHDINEAVERSLTFMALHAKQYRCDIRKELGADLPRVRINLNQIQQVLLNLLTNACQAMPDGGRVVVSTQAAADRGAVELSVVDVGCGIPPEEIPLVFEPFFTRKREGKGTGLGLSISYKIVQDHGGAIRIQSEPGRGTTVTVSIPVAPGA